jgi:hypothetical protein
MTKDKTKEVPEMSKRYHLSLRTWVAVAIVMAATPCLRAEYVDLNNDGFTDMVYVRSDSVIVSLNDQNASFGQHCYPVDNSASSLCAVDIDNDNDLDLAVANESSQPLSVLINLGDGSFQDVVNYGKYHVYGNKICAGDLNLDGFPDIVIHEESGWFVYFTNRGDGTFDHSFQYGYMPGFASYTLIADMDGDTDNDLITIGRLISIRFNDGSGSFDPNGNFYDVKHSWPIIAASDFTSDSSIDILVCGWGGGALYTNDGFGRLEERLAWSLPNTGNGLLPTGEAIGDFNGDGIPDLVSGVVGMDDHGYIYTGVGVSISDGNGEFVPWGGFGFGGIEYYVWGCGDFNGDGILDIIGDGGGYGIMFGLGDGTFQSGNPTDVSGDMDHHSIPSDYNLSQNYPNPFNPSTRIDFTIPKHGHVTISIYNSIGQKVATIVDDTKPAGEYSIIWNGRDNSGKNVASGIYFYRLIVGEQTKTKKMLLIK